MISLTSQNFADIVAEGAVLVDFWADVCAPCRALIPVLEALDRDVPELTIGKVDIQKERDLALSWGVNALPTLVFFVNGVEKTRMTGLHTREQIVEILERASRL